MRTMSQALLDHIETTNNGERDHGRDWQKVNCPYCLDNHHLAMERHWAKVGAIPHEVDAADYYMPTRRPELVYVRCDCLRDMSSKDEQPKTFQDYFREPVRTHWYGRRLMEVRHAMARRLEEGYRPGSDGHMHMSEADEYLAGEHIADPAENHWPEDEFGF